MKSSRLRDAPINLKSYSGQIFENKKKIKQQRKHMRNKILNLTALSLLTASMSCMSFAGSTSAETAGCAEARAKLEQVLNKAHSANKFMNIKFSSDVLKVGCSAGFVYEVDNEKDKSELHYSFVNYLNSETDYHISNAHQYQKI